MEVFNLVSLLVYRISNMIHVEIQTIDLCNIVLGDRIQKVHVLFRLSSCGAASNEGDRKVSPLFKSLRTHSTKFITSFEREILVLIVLLMGAKSLDHLVTLMNIFRVYHQLYQEMLYAGTFQRVSLFSFQLPFFFFFST